MQTKKLSEEIRCGLVRGKDLGRAELGNNRYAVVNVYDGSVRIHIRQYAEKGYPTKTGVSLSVDAWNNLTSHMTQVSAMIAEATESLENARSKDVKKYKTALGDSIYLTYASDYMCVNVRRYFVPEGETAAVPTRWGIALKLLEWRALCEAVDFINDYCSPVSVKGVESGVKAVLGFDDDDDCKFNVPCVGGGVETLHTCMEAYMACAMCHRA
jgi:Transcriptional Coactivator p15 (PC4)